MSKTQFIHDTLVNFAKSKDTKGLRVFISEEKDTIEKIVTEYGSSNRILTDAYDKAYKEGNFDFAGEYQRLLEQINPLALFGEDG
jgi:hypothetical protein